VLLRAPGNDLDPGAWYTGTGSKVRRLQAGG